MWFYRFTVLLIFRFFFRVHLVSMIHIVKCYCKTNHQRKGDKKEEVHKLHCQKIDRKGTPRIPATFCSITHPG